MTLCPDDKNSVTLGMRLIGCFLLLLAMLLAACEKDGPTTKQIPATLTLEFEATFEGEAIQYNTKWYRNFSGDSFTVQKFNYYISNIQLIRKDGSKLPVPESYYLMEHAEGKQRAQLTGLPAGEFKGIEFLIGVDSLRNTSGSQSGALDPSNNMFWDWNTGYIFFKLEGQYNTLTQPVHGDYAIHIGGFEEPNNCIQRYAVDFPSSLITKSAGQSFIYFHTKLEEVFVNPRFIDFDYYYANLGNGIFRQLSDNYADMFEPYKVVNP